VTELLLGARDETPEAICGCCARMASSVGVIHPPGQNVLWLCEICTTKNGLKVADMNPMKLIETEAQALDAAAGQTIEDVFDAVLQVLWGEGIRDLEAMNGENYPSIMSKIAQSPDYQEAIRKTFLAYGQNVRTALTNIRD
jgi:hypothetical protein